MAAVAVEAPAAPTRLITPHTEPQAELGKVLSPTQVRSFLSPVVVQVRPEPAGDEEQLTGTRLGCAPHPLSETFARTLQQGKISKHSVVALFRSEWHGLSPA